MPCTENPQVFFRQEHIVYRRTEEHGHTIVRYGETLIPAAVDDSNKVWPGIFAVVLNLMKGNNGSGRKAHHPYLSNSIFTGVVADILHRYSGVIIRKSHILHTGSPVIGARCFPGVFALKQLFGTLCFGSKRLKDSGKAFHRLPVFIQHWFGPVFQDKRRNTAFVQFPCDHRPFSVIGKNLETASRDNQHS